MEKWVRFLLVLTILSFAALATTMPIAGCASKTGYSKGFEEAD